MAAMRIFVLMGHPETDSFNGALADAYVAAARRAGHEVRRQDLGRLAFDPVLRGGYADPPPLEPDLIAAQDNLLWCERFMLFYPMWWGGMPALLKGWFDRVLLPSFAFDYHETGSGWDKRLAGRTAQIVSTCDCPVFYARLWYRNSDFTCLKRAILGFCGVKTERILRIGRVKLLDAAARQKAIGKVEALVR
jgi:putative NADPH-quinone reductase